VDDIAGRADIEALVNEFYTSAFADPLIGHIFTDVAKMDLAHHLPIMCDFWETVLFAAGLYRRATARRTDRRASQTAGRPDRRLDAAPPRGTLGQRVRNHPPCGTGLGREPSVKGRDDPGRERDYHAALASPARRQVLDVLVQAAEPLDAAAVADHLGLHVTTARFHLDQLVDAGLARRNTGTERRRGRPRVLFTPAGAARQGDSREQLIEVLASTIASDANGVQESLRAGRRWADELGPDAAVAGEPVSGLIDALDRLGFDPDPAPDAGVIRLHDCPFRSAAREHPDIVCNVHRGLVERLLEGSEAQPRLIPFAEPELCLVALGGPEGDRT
jgi:predicted ArsR family transcriptional regulator